MFNGKTCWFAPSVGSIFREKWRAEGGNVANNWRQFANYFGFYVFSEHADEQHEREIFAEEQLIILQPNYIMACVEARKLLPVGNFVQEPPLQSINNSSNIFVTNAPVIAQETRQQKLQAKQLAGTATPSKTSGKIEKQQKTRTSEAASNSTVGKAAAAVASAMASSAQHETASSLALDDASAPAESSSSIKQAKSVPVPRAVRYWQSFPKSAKQVMQRFEFFTNDDPFCLILKKKKKTPQSAFQ